MSNGVVISDAGPIFSLAAIEQLPLLKLLFDQVKIPRGVREEITKNKKAYFYKSIENYFADRVLTISDFSQLFSAMDYGETEAVLLYKEIDADYLLIDDKKARKIAETLNIKCIGTLGILSSAKRKGLIKELRP